MIANLKAPGRSGWWHASKSAHGDFKRDKSDLPKPQLSTAKIDIPQCPLLRLRLIRRQIFIFVKPKLAAGEAFFSKTGRDDSRIWRT
jgi:hypothetical protein